jgi:hypothetical protein
VIGVRLIMQIWPEWGHSGQIIIPVFEQTDQA